MDPLDLRAAAHRPRSPPRPGLRLRLRARHPDHRPVAGGHGLGGRPLRSAGGGPGARRGLHGVGGRVVALDRAPQASGRIRGRAYSAAGGSACGGGLASPRVPVKSTLGASSTRSRMAGSISKNSSSVNRNMEAMRFEGKAWTRWL